MINPGLIEKAAERTPIISDIADVITEGGKRRTYTAPEDPAKMRLTGGALGAVGGGLGGGLAGLLGHYVAAGKKKRELKDYLKSMIISGGVGSGLGGLGLGWAGGRLGEEMRSRNPWDLQAAEGLGLFE